MGDEAQTTMRGCKTSVSSSLRGSYHKPSSQQQETETRCRQSFASPGTATTAGTRKESQKGVLSHTFDSRPYHGW